MKVDNVTPANELITKDYSLEQTYMLEAVFDVRDGFGDVHVEDLADEVHVKLECKRQIAQDRLYYIVQGNRRRCYVFTDAEGTVQNIIGVDRNFPTLDEIRENDYNLNIPRYVDTFEEEAPIDIQAVKKNIADIEAELAQVQEQMKKYLDELGL